MKVRLDHRRALGLALAVLLAVFADGNACNPGFTGNALGAEQQNPPKESAADGMFRAMVNRFVDETFRLYPERATEAGNHRYDGEVGDLSRTGILSRILYANNWKRAFEAPDAAAISPRNEADREWLIACADDVLLWNERATGHHRPPGAKHQP